MNTKKWLNEVAYKDTIDLVCDGKIADVYISKFDDSYITHVGMENQVKYLAEREITEQLTHGVGFSPKDKKWYGWSHRAIYGFNVGSECKKGMCHYTASTPEELIDDRAEFYADISEECADRKRAECQILEDRSGIRILPSPQIIPVIDDINEIQDVIENGTQGLEMIDICKDDFYVIKCGKGEWTAKTMEDAKQMAVDFNEGVS